MPLVLDRMILPIYAVRVNIRPLISADEIASALPQIARRIDESFPGKDNVCVLVLMDGAMWFACDLLRLLPTRFVVCPIKVSSYGKGRVSSGHLSWLSPLPNVRDKQVLILDDVFDSGLTLDAVSNELKQAGARRILCAVAIEKDIPRTVSFRPDFSLFRLGNGFLVGYGMDCAEEYRNLPFIGLIEG